MTLYTLFTGSIVKEYAKSLQRQESGGRDLEEDDQVCVCLFTYLFVCLLVRFLCVCVYFYMLYTCTCTVYSLVVLAIIVHNTV